MSALYLLMAESGYYSDRLVWPVALFSSIEGAESFLLPKTYDDLCGERFELMSIETDSQIETIRVRSYEREKTDVHFNGGAIKRIDE